MNVEHSDVRACTQGVYSCLVKRLLRDYRQQHPQTSDSVVVHMREYNGRLRTSTRKISTRILIPRESRACANRLYQALFSSPAKNGRERGRGSVRRYRIGRRSSGARKNILSAIALKRHPEYNYTAYTAYSCIIIVMHLGLYTSFFTQKGS